MISTIAHRVANAKRFIDANQLWLLVGGTTPWPDEENPPLPTLETSAVSTLIGAKLASAKLVIRDDVNGDEAFLSAGVLTKWRSIPTFDAALAEGVRWVLVRASLVSDELPLTTFREVGISSNLTKAVGVPIGKQALSVSDILDVGTLEALEYRKPVTRLISGTYEIVTIIEF